MHIRNHAQRKHIIDSVSISWLWAPRRITLTPTTLVHSSKRCSTNLQSCPASCPPQSSRSSLAQQPSSSCRNRAKWIRGGPFGSGTSSSSCSTSAASGHIRSLARRRVGLSSWTSSACVCSRSSSLYTTTVSYLTSLTHEAFTPSKPQLVLLDLLLLVLSVILTTIAYDTSYVLASRKDIIDPLAATPTTPFFSGPVLSTNSPSTPRSAADDTRLVIDFHLSNIVTHLRNPPPPPEQGPSSNDLLPMPNTASLLSLRQMLWQRNRRASARTGETDAETGGEGRGNGAGSRMVPGGLDVESGG